MIAFASNEAAGFYDLPALIGGVLSRTGASISALDLGLSGDSIRYATDHGDLELLGRLHDDGAWQVTVTCDAVGGLGRQLCFQVVRRLIGRFPVSSVFWQPTRQRLAPGSFTWHALTVSPRRWRAPSITIFPANHAAATI
ncbi:hypothetical protein [Palleronia marisminoris]|nr:hypothetical protein [Palleronia marisminoris]